MELARDIRSGRFDYVEDDGVLSYVCTVARHDALDQIRARKEDLVDTPNEAQEFAENLAEKLKLMAQVMEKYGLRPLEQFHPERLEPERLWAACRDQFSQLDCKCKIMLVTKCLPEVTHERMAWAMQPFFTVKNEDSGKNQLKDCRKKWHAGLAAEITSSR
jgi:hypothetical protein